MRMRKKKNLTQRILACDHLLIKSPEENHEKMKSAAKQKLARLEIGCGKGGFVCECAMREPNVEFFAFERIANVIVSAMERAQAAGIGNVHFINADARDLQKWFLEGSFDRIYINFCDPWPKKRHEKNRLTHIGFLAIYKKLLRESGELWFKTDNEDLFNFSLSQFEAAKYKVLWKTRDLHYSEMTEENIMTEYESHFTSLGMKIHSAKVSPTSLK